MTGNYGMGKSSVLGMFRELGAATASADEFVGSLLGEDAVLERIRSEFGDGFFLGDGRLDKSKIAKVIFTDRNARVAMENILHPLVFKMIEDFLDRAIKEGVHKVAVVEIPLLFERRYMNRIDKTVTVYADKGTIFRRLERSGMSRDDTVARLNSQMPVKEKIRLSDYAIDNNGSPDETRAQVKSIYEMIIEGRRG